MLKLLHLADIHLGAKFVELGPKGLKQRAKLAETFSTLPKIAKEKGAQLVLISGDLFDSPFPSKTSVEIVNKTIAELVKQDICVAISAGTHDYLAAGGVFTSGQIDTSSESIFVFSEPKPTTHLFAKLNVAVSARSLDSNRSNHSPLEGLTPNPQAGINIAMAHGSVALPGLKVPADDWVMKPEELEGSPFNYIALGHWHGLKEMVTAKAWYPGSPEWIGTDQKGSGNMLYIEVDDKKKVNVVAVAVGTTVFERLEIDLGSIKTADSELSADKAGSVGTGATALKDKILAKSSKNIIREVVLKGVRDENLIIDVRALEEALGVDFEVLKIKDQSVVKMEVPETDEKTLVSEYLSQMSTASANAKTDSEKQELDEAAWIGAKLLKGEESGL